MQKLIVKNFGPLTEVELPIRDFTILIGQNGSGKSLLAKLAYFFNEIPEILTESLFIRNSVPTAEESPIGPVDKVYDRLFKKQLPSLFRNLFGSKEFLRINTEIIFEWESGLIISIRSTPHFLANFHLNSSSRDQFRAVLDALSTPDPKSTWPPERRVVTEISTLFGNQGKRRFTRYIPENRGAYNFFNDFYLSSAYSQRLQIVDNPETGYFEDQYYLEKKFWRSRKNATQIYERDWELNIIQDVELGARSQAMAERLQKFHASFSEIIQGEFVVKNGAEFIRLNSGELIPTDRVSSGQKEAIGAIPILFDDLMHSKLTYSVIEEPEAHLYPMTQQKIAQQLVSFFNGSEGSRLFLTTHSPYILATLDNSVQAFSIAQKNEEGNETVNSILNETFWLNIERVEAFYVSPTGKLKSIKDLERSSLGGEELDKDSACISEDYDKLLELKYPFEE